MLALPIADWAQALDRMTEAVNRTLDETDHARARWGMLLEPTATTSSNYLLFERFEKRLNLMDSRLHSADELAAIVEKLLTERAAEIDDWRAVFAQWRELLKQVEEKATRSPG